MHVWFLLWFFFFFVIDNKNFIKATNKYKINKRKKSTKQEEKYKKNLYQNSRANKTKKKNQRRKHYKDHTAECKRKEREMIEIPISNGCVIPVVVVSTNA